MSTPHGYVITIYVPSGDPNALRLIQKSNWSGSGLMAPRSIFPEVRQRKELKLAGVYVLSGPPEESGLPRIYVGEGDPVGPRLDSHAQKKDFWTSLVVFSGERLNKAHVQHLESRLVHLAAATKQCVLENDNTPQLPSLSEGEVANAEGFLSEMLLCFPVLGIGAFSPAGSGVLVSGGPRGPRAKAAYVLRAKGIEAWGEETTQGFLVKAGGHAVAEAVPSQLPHLKELRRALVKNGVLKEVGGRFELSQDYTFASASAAAGLLLGRSANGRTEWKTLEGRMLKEVQEFNVQR